MSEFDDDDFKVAACFLCDDMFTKNKKSWMIFDEFILNEHQIITTLSDILASALGCEVVEGSVHSTLLCTNCKTLILKYKTTEQLLIELRNDIITTYNRTAESYSQIPFKIDIEITAEEDNNENYEALDSEDESTEIINEEILNHNTNDKFIEKNVLTKNSSNIKTNKNLDPLLEALQSNEEEPGVITLNEVKAPANITKMRSEISTIKENNECQKFSNKNSEISTSSCNPLQCEVCNKTFQQIKTFKKHKYSHAAQARKTKCKVCQKILTTRHYKKHKLRCKNDDLSNDEQPPEENMDENPFDDVEYDNNTLKNVYKCAVCEKLFATKVTLKHHLENHKRNENETDPLKNNERLSVKLKTIGTSGSNAAYKCDKCGKIYATWESLRYHKGIHSEILYECHICKVNFTHKRNLRKHKLIHIKERLPTYECDICQKKFFNKTSLFQHKQVHTSQTYKCETCGKQYAQLRNLKEHQKRESGRRFQCKFCNKTFTFKVPMKEHEGTHVDASEYQFKCENCEKKFYTTTELKRHKVVHTNNLGFECDICQRKFWMKNVLDHHKAAIHMGIRNYLCDICGKSFAYPGTLQSHYAVHKTECPLECKICKKRFKDRQRLSNHSYKVHNIRKYIKTEKENTTEIETAEIETTEIETAEIETTEIETAEIGETEIETTIIELTEIEQEDIKSEVEPIEIEEIEKEEEFLGEKKMLEDCVVEQDDIDINVTY